MTEGGSGVAGSRADATWIDHLPAWAKRLAAVGTTADDDEEIRLQKASLVMMVVTIATLAPIWVATYSLLDLHRSAAIPGAYALVSIAGLGILARTGRFDLFSVGQLGLILLLPFLLQWSLGGFVPSSAVMLWAVCAPVGALIYTARPLPWFIAYLALTVVSGLLEPALEPAAMPIAVNVAFFVLNMGCVSLVVYVVLRYFTQGFAAERRRSETLLRNVLPAAVVHRLKAGERPLADRFEEVAVLFADLVGFTGLAERLPPERVVELLDQLFSRFDAMADRRDLEKIKTIGDSYMVVGGLPQPRPDGAEQVAEMALEMQAATAGLSWPDGEPVSLRIGIDVGPVVAGVIGERKFAYDLWGDTVNTASRMQSHGLPGEIQVTSRTYRRLAGGFRFESRGPVTVKGKGELHPYVLVGRRE